MSDEQNTLKTSSSNTKHHILVYLWHNYQYIQRISCKSYKNLFWKIFEGGNRIPDCYILRNGHDRKALKKTINDFEKKTCTINNTANNNNNNNKKQAITFPWIPKIGPK